MDQNFPDEIARRGYWRIHFRPLAATESLRGLQSIEQAITTSTVRLRGWPYPFASSQKGMGENAIEFQGTFVQGWGDWEQFREFWRMYESSQFINYRGLHEDWEDRSDFRRRAEYNPNSRRLRVTATIFQVTEFFAFLARLKERGLYDTGVEASISLRNSGPRSLQADETRQIPFMFAKVSHAADLQCFDERLFPENILEVARNATQTLLRLFDKFGWNPPSEQISGQVVAYLEGRA